MSYVTCINPGVNTCGRPLSPVACSFSFIRATLAAVALFFAPFLPLLVSEFFFDSDKSIEDIQTGLLFLTLQIKNI